jgi:predicted TIM-barrel fold metal-dependent hydrolase
VTPSPIRDQVPSEVFSRHVFATFFRDKVGGHSFEWWGNDNCMWSTDYPHGNSTWPHSREIMERNLARLSPEQKYKLVCGNVTKLYNIEVPS